MIFSESKFFIFPHHCCTAVWKNEITLAEKHLVNNLLYLVISIIKALLSRNCCQKSVRLSVENAEILSHILCEKFVKAMVFKKKSYHHLIQLRSDPNLGSISGPFCRFTHISHNTSRFSDQKHFQTRLYMLMSLCKSWFLYIKMIALSFTHLGIHSFLYNIIVFHMIFVAENVFSSLKICNRTLFVRSSRVQFHENLLVETDQ